METSTILIIIFGIITFLVLTILFFVNNLIIKKENVDHQFESVIKYLQERVTLLERISNFIEENTTNEEKYIKNLNKSNINLNKIDKLSKEALKEIKNSLSLLKKFSKISEIYPKFNKNSIYKTIIEEIELNENRINYSIESYNKEAKKYNELKQKNKINTIISKILKLNDYEYYDK